VNQDDFARGSIHDHRVRRGTAHQPAANNTYFHDGPPYSYPSPRKSGSTIPVRFLYVFSWITHNWKTCYRRRSHKGCPVAFTMILQSTRYHLGHHHRQRHQPRSDSVPDAAASKSCVCSCVVIMLRHVVRSIICRWVSTGTRSFPM